MLGVHPERMMTFPKELQDILGFKMCKGAGHLFAGNPRSELPAGSCGLNQPMVVAPPSQGTTTPVR